jgi:tetratricopeptide (TPR) repeat protein
LRDYTGALTELEVAGRDLPNDPRIFELTGYVLRRQGKREEGLRALEQAVTMDPRNIHILSQIADSYGDLHRYAQEVEVLDRALQIMPDDVGLRAIRTYIDLVWHANPEPMRQLVERVRSEQPASLSNVADNWFDYALVKHDWTAAEQALIALGDDPFWVDGNIMFSRQFGEGLLARAMRDDARARRAFDAARIEQEQIVQEQRDYGPALCILGLIDAALGKKELALQEGRRALELLPAEKDATDGQALIGYFALIAAWAGEKELALQQLEVAVRLPGASFISSYGMLKLYPFWDPLRGDPRFEKIVADLAPKDGKK